MFRPSVDGDLRKGTQPVRSGLTFHGLGHCHKTWLIADGIPEIAQARRLGHHLSNRLVETDSLVAPEIEHRLLKVLEQRWQQTQHDLLRALERRWHYAHQTRRPADNRPRRTPARRAPHTAPALRAIPGPARKETRPQLTTTRTRSATRNQEAITLPNFSTSVHPGDQHPRRITIINRIKKASDQAQHLNQRT